MADGLNAIHSYSDPGLDRQKVFEYELSVRLRADSLSYCILDSKTNKFLHLETWELNTPGRSPFIPGDTESDETGRLAELLVDELSWITNGFMRTRLILDQGKSSLLPAALFREEDRKTVFEFNIAGGPYPEEELLHDHLASLNAYTIYHVPKGINKLLSKHFYEASKFHFSTALIQAIFLKNMNRDNENKLFVNVGNGRMDLLRIKAKKLDYYNSFRFNTAEDFMYYLIFVVEQLGLNPENVDMQLMGELDKHSSITDLCRKYVRNVGFVPRNDDFRYSFVFDQLPGHYYFNLLNASLCE